MRKVYQPLILVVLLLGVVFVLDASKEKTTGRGVEDVLLTEDFRESSLETGVSLQPSERSARSSLQEPTVDQIFRAPSGQLSPPQIERRLVDQIACMKPQRLPAGFSDVDNADIYDNVIVYNKMGPMQQGSSYTNVEALYVYDLGPNRQLDLDPQGNPIGDDRGPFLIESSFGRGPLFSTMSPPSIFSHTLVYAFLEAPQELNKFAKITIKRVNSGSDKLFGTADDTKHDVHQWSCQLPLFGSIFIPCLEVNSYPVIRGNIVSWQELIMPQAIGYVGYSCDLTKNGNHEGCLLQDTKRGIFGGLDVYKLFSTSSAGWNSVWVHAPGLFGRLHQRGVLYNKLDATQTTPFLPGVQLYGLGDILADTSTYVFTEIDSAGVSTHYLSQVNQPSIKNQISPPSSLGAGINYDGLRISQLLKDNKRLIVWNQNSVQETGSIYASFLSSPFVQQPASIDFGIHPSVSGDTVVFTDLGGKGKRQLYVSKCSAY